MTVVSARTLRFPEREVSLPFGLPGGTIHYWRAELPDGQVLFGAGVYALPWGKAGEAFLQPEPLISEYRIQAITAASDIMIQIEAEFRYLQAHVPLADAKALKFAEWFGFRPLEVLHDYGPDGDAYVLMIANARRLG